MRAVVGPLISVAVLALVLAARPRVAWAEPSAAERETARSLMRQGDASYERRDWTSALEAYRAADAIMGVPTTRLPLARALERLGRLVEARDHALAAARYPAREDEPPPFAEARSEAKTFSNELAERIPTIALRLSVPAAAAAVATVEIDGKPLPAEALSARWKVDPGHHEVRARAKGFRDAFASVTLSEREERTVVLTLVAPPTRRPREAREGGPGAAAPLIVGGFGLAAVGAIVGTVTGLVAWRKTVSIEGECQNGVCPEQLQGDADAADHYATAANVAFIAAGLGVVAGVLGVVVAPRSRSSPAARVLIAPGGVAAARPFLRAPHGGGLGLNW